MSDFVKSISSYNLFNNLLPGVVFCVLASKLFPISLVQKDLITGVFFYYFVGLVIGRIGSVIIEPILKFTGFISFSNYPDYIEASKTDKNLKILSETNNMYRSILSMFLFLVAISFHFYLSSKFEGFSDYVLYLYVFGLIVLFAWSYKKQSQYIKVRVLKRNLYNDENSK